MTVQKEEIKINDYHTYKEMMQMLSANVPIQVLCLPKKIEQTLINNKFTLVSDLIYSDFRKVKGIGPKASDIIFARVEEFVSV